MLRGPVRCTECYVCVRQKVCPVGAIETVELDGFFKQFQHVMSDPVENHGVTGVTGRGTEEVKTNDVSGRVKKGFAGFSIDMGRPGLGVFLRDAEKVAMAMAEAGLVFEPPETTPLSALMTDMKTGKLDDACLDYHLLSVIIEGSCTLDKCPTSSAPCRKLKRKSTPSSPWGSSSGWMKTERTPPSGSLTPSASHSPTAAR